MKNNKTITTDTDRAEAWVGLEIE